MLVLLVFVVVLLLGISAAADDVCSFGRISASFSSDLPALSIDQRSRRPVQVISAKLKEAPSKSSGIPSIDEVLARLDLEEQQEQETY